MSSGGSVESLPCFAEQTAETVCVMHVVTMLPLPVRYSCTRRRNLSVLRMQTIVVVTCRRLLQHLVLDHTVSEPVLFPHYLGSAMEGNILYLDLCSVVVLVNLEY